MAMRDIAEAAALTEGAVASGAHRPATAPAVASSGDPIRDPPKAPRKKQGMHRIPGRRPMKEYPLTAGELWTLGGLQAGAALAFGLAGGCFGFWLNLQEAIAFSDHVEPHVLGYWNGLGTAAICGTVLLGLTGVVLLALSGVTAYNIIKGTLHD